MMGSRLRCSRRAARTCMKTTCVFSLKNNCVFSLKHNCVFSLNYMCLFSLNHISVYSLLPNSSIHCFHTPLFATLDKHVYKVKPASWAQMTKMLVLSKGMISWRTTLNSSKTKPLLCKLVVFYNNFALVIPSRRTSLLQWRLSNCSVEIIYIT